MALNRVRQFLFSTLRRQLVVGMTLVLTLMMSVFIWDMSIRQQVAMLHHQTDQAVALTRNVATSSAVWVASRDFSGLQEIVQGISHYPELRHAIVLDVNGLILAHTDPVHRGQYLLDLPPRAALSILQQNANLVDVISPVMLNNTQIGWVRIGLSGQELKSELNKITRDGIFYTVFAIALSIALASFAGRYLTRRLNAIQTVADAVQAGNTDLRVAIAGQDEAAQLARQFNNMLDTLRLREQALAASEKQFRTLVQSIPEAVYRCALDEHWTMFFMSDHIETLSGYPASDFLGNQVRSYASIIYPQDVDKVDRAVRGGVAIRSTYTIEYRIVHRNGEIHWVFEKGQATFDNQGNTLWLDGVITDISERKQAEQTAQQLRDQLIQATKMEAVGHLTAGIAHDFNNMLGAIMGYSELSKHMLAAGQPEAIAAYLDEVLKASNRAKELIAQMLTFSRNPTDSNSAPAPVTQLAPVIKEVIALLRSSIPSTISLHYQIADEELKTRIHAVQLHQIILNLCINARDAIGEYGNIDITLQQQHSSEQLCSSCQHVFSGDFAQLSVRDSGSGIDEQILKNIFNPFFTTKGVGKGTGMGLSVVHGLVHAQGGHIQVRSTPGKGSEIIILLPLSLSQAHAAVSQATAESHINNLAGMRIMVVDDEPAMTSMLQEFLGLQGAQISIFNTPLDAWQAFEKAPDAIDMLITDETMPGLSGMHLAERMLKLKPGLPVILCTGYSEQASPTLAAQAGIAGFFYKPLKLNELLNKIQQLRAPTSAPGL